MVVRKEVCLKSRVQEQSPEVSPAVENNSPEVSPAVENNSPEVGDEDRVYEPGVGDKVEENGNGDGGGDEVRACVHAMGDQKIRRSEDVFLLEYYWAL